MIRRLTASVAVTTVAVAAMVSSTPAQAAQTLEVEVGRFFDEADRTAESMRFYPSAASVVTGDTLRFTTTSLHGVTLLPAGVDSEAWAAENATDGGPWSPFVGDTDEGANAAKVNLQVASPSRNCGWPGQDPCEFDGTGDEVIDPLNSGLAVYPTASGAEIRELSFAVTITADPGSVIFVVDPLRPEMKMRIEVVGSFAERSDVFELKEASEAQFAADETRAQQLHNSYSKKKVKKTVNGKVVWSAWSGVEEDGISLRRTYPKKLTIKKGNAVKWIFAKNIYEAHTVTFPLSKVAGAADKFPEIVCDSDGDEGSAADTQPNVASYPFCSAGSLELDVPTSMVKATGDGKLTSPKDAESSGARGAAYATTNKPYQLVFPKKSPVAGFKYGCVIHEAAKAPHQGTVVVK